MIPEKNPECVSYTFYPATQKHTIETAMLEALSWFSVFLSVPRVQVSPQSSALALYHHPLGFWVTSKACVGQSRAREGETQISVAISSQAYLILIKALVTVNILKCSECLTPEVKLHCKRRKQKTMRGNRWAVSPACVSLINTCTELRPYDFSFTEFSSPKGLINFTDKQPWNLSTLPLSDRDRSKTQKPISKGKAEGWNCTLFQ